MDKILTVDKQNSQDVILWDGDTPLFKIHGHTVYQQDRPLWQIDHSGDNLFAGAWKISLLPEKTPLAGYRYIQSSYRFGEDLKIVHFDLDVEFFFRRIDPEKDRWLLISRTGQVILETFHQSPSSALEFHLKGNCDENALWPIICLLIFDRLVCNRF